MTKPKEITERQGKAGVLFTLFSIWTFFIICRPQDYIVFLNKLRPSLVLGIITLILFMTNKNKNVINYSNKQIKLYKYLIMIFIACVPFSYYPRLSLNELILYSNVILFFFLFYGIVDSLAGLRKILFMYSLGASLYAIYSLRVGNFSEERLSFGTAFDPNDIAFFLISFITFNFIFISGSNRTSVRFISCANIIISAVVLLKTGSRGGLISLIAVMIVLFFASSHTLNISFIKKAALIILVLISVQFLNINNERFETLLKPQNDYNYSDETGRVSLWKIGLKMMASRPLTGVGLDCFPEGVGREREKVNANTLKWQTAHNSFVQIGAETGIFGLILFCLMSINVFRITGEIIYKSQCEDLIKVAEMTRAGYAGHLISSMFLSQALSVYWAFYIVLSAVLQRMLYDGGERRE